jgi:curved DNA-binding protein CbpA
LGIGEDEELTHERIRMAYKRASLTAHPDKGGSAEKFDELKRAFTYVEKLIDRIRGKAEDRARFTAPVTMETAMAARFTPTGSDLAMPGSRDSRGPVTLSAKKLDMNLFNKMFEQNKLPDPERDTGYGDWLKSQEGGEDVVVDPRLSSGKKVTSQLFDQVFRERAHAGAGAIVRKTEPDALITPGGTELGGEVDDYTAAFGSGTQFTDIKQAYTTKSTFSQEVANVRVKNDKVSLEEACRARDAEMKAPVQRDEQTRILESERALKERERKRLLRLANQDIQASTWFEQMAAQLFVTDK